MATAAGVNSRPIIFISHSARQDPVALGYLKKITATLKASGFDVLVDQDRLKPGQPWRSCLDLWMAHCHAAVILLSEKALGKSEWVLKEATILRWRDSLEALNGRKSGFQLIPVFLGVGSTQVDAAPGFGPLKLSEIEALRGLKPVPLAKKLVRTLEPLLQKAGDSPRRLLETKIANQLANVTDNTLKAMATALQVDLGDFEPYRDLAPQVAMLMLHAPLGQLADALGVLAGAVSNESVKAIFEMLAHSWVDSEAAGLVGRVVRESPPERTLLLNVTEPRFGAKAYIARAGDRFPLWPHEFVTDASGGKAFGAVKRQVLDSLRRRYGSSMGDAFLQSYVSREGQNAAFFIVVHPPDEKQPLMEEAEIGSIQAYFKGATILLCSGATLPESSILPLVRRIQPELGANEELDSFALFAQCASRAGVTFGET
jgi:TIR domain